MERTLCPHLGQSSVGTRHSGGEPDSSSQEVIYRKAGSLSLGRSQAERVQPGFCWGTWRHSQRPPGMDPLKDCPWARRVWPGLMWLWCYWESRSPELQKPQASCLHKHFNLHWTHGLGRAVDFTPIFGKKKQAQRNKVHGVTAHLKQPQVLKGAIENRLCDSGLALGGPRLMHTAFLSGIQGPSNIWPSICLESKTNRWRVTATKHHSKKTKRNVLCKTSVTAHSHHWQLPEISSWQIAYWPISNYQHRLSPIRNEMGILLGFYFSRFSILAGKKPFLTFCLHSGVIAFVGMIF